MDYLDFFFDGFDSPSAVAQLAGDWHLTTAEATALTTRVAFDNKQCLRMGQVGYGAPTATHLMDATHDYILAGCRVENSTIGHTGSRVFVLTAGGTLVCGLVTKDTVGTGSFRTGSTLATELFEIAGCFQTAAAYYEIEVYRHAVNGFVGVYRDGTLLDSFSGDTAAIASSMNGFRLAPLRDPSWGGESYYRDVYVCGIENWTTVGGNNLGPGESVVIVPDADDSVQFTPLGAGTNWSEVDELPNDADTSHNESNTQGHEDVFTHGGLTETGTIFAVAVEHTARRTADGLTRLYDVVESGAVRDEGNLVTLGTTYLNRLGEVHLKDPNGTAAWTSARVNALKFGYGNEV